MIALAGLPDHPLSMNAPPGAQILIIVLMNHEAWGCDLDERGINGPAWCFQLYLLWTGAPFVRSKAWGNRCGKGRERAILSAASRKLSWARLPFRPMVATLPVAIAFGLQWALRPAISAWPWLLLFAIILFSSWPAELCVGLFARAMSTQSSGISCLPPERSLKVAESVYVFWCAVSAVRASSLTSSMST
jgi:hypothetical protein